jgi:hypothetical protein
MFDTPCWLGRDRDAGEACPCWLSSMLVRPILYEDISVNYLEGACKHDLVC